MHFFVIDLTLACFKIYLENQFKKICFIYETIFYFLLNLKNFHDHADFDNIILHYHLRIVSERNLKSLRYYIFPSKPLLILYSFPQLTILKYFFFYLLFYFYLVVRYFHKKRRIIQENNTKHVKIREKLKKKFTLMAFKRYRQIYH